MDDAKPCTSDANMKDVRSSKLNYPSKGSSQSKNRETENDNFSQENNLSSESENEQRFNQNSDQGQSSQGGGQKGDGYIALYQK